MIKTTFDARLRDDNYKSTSKIEQWEGYKFDLPFGLTGFVRNDGYYWNVTESSTGLSVGKSFDTRKEAIEDAINTFNTIGKENVIKAIQRQKEYYQI